MRTDKRGTLYLSMNVMGVGISARLDISMPKGTNDANGSPLLRILIPILSDPKWGDTSGFQELEYLKDVQFDKTR